MAHHIYEASLDDTNKMRFKYGSCNFVPAAQKLKDVADYPSKTLY